MGFFNLNFFLKEREKKKGKTYTVNGSTKNENEIKSVNIQNKQASWKHVGCNGNNLSFLRSGNHREG